MNTECDICCENQFIIPCGALNNCKANVCNKCKIYSNIDAYYPPFTSKCHFCKTSDNKNALINEISFTFDNIVSSNIYVVFLQQTKQLLELLEIDEDIIYQYEKMQYCLPCDEEYSN